MLELNKFISFEIVFKISKYRIEWNHFILKSNLKTKLKIELIFVWNVIENDKSEYYF